MEVPTTKHGIQYSETTSTRMIRGENMKDIVILENMGTNMTQSDFEKLSGEDGIWELTQEEAIMAVNKEFGFEASQIRIVLGVENYYKDGNRAKPYQTYTRVPQYCATDCNYIRFDVRGWQYEMVNGSLKFYYN